MSAHPIAEDTATRGLKIGLFCGYGCGNIGNDASLEVAAEVIAADWPKAQVVVITPFVDGAGAQTSRQVVAMNPSMQAASALDAHVLIKFSYFALRECVEMPRRFRTLRNLDGVIAPGTGLLDDFAESPAGMPYAVFAWALAARLARRPFAMVGIGAGPIISPASRLLMRLAARLATEISYRDEESRAYMAAVDTRIGDHAVVCDLTFAAVLPGTPVPRLPDLHRRPLTVGVGVMAYGGWSGNETGTKFKHYAREMARVLRGLIADGHEIRLFAGQPIDDIAIEAVLGCLSDTEQAHVVFEPAREFVELLREVAQSDVVVATRYHNIVAALMMRRPVVSIGYAAKNAALLARVEMPNHDYPIEHVDADWVLAQVRELVASDATISPAASAVLNGWRSLARETIQRAASRIRRRTDNTVLKRPQPGPC